MAASPVDSICTTNSESLSVAIYGLPECDEVNKTVNKLFLDIQLGNIVCKSAYRTPARQNRLGVVIAELNSVQDKQEILQRKRLLRVMPEYANVFVKTSMSHTEQVMDANFNMVLTEKTNGSSYFVSDNGRIRRKTAQPSSWSGATLVHGGARQKEVQMTSYNTGHQPTYSSASQLYDRYKQNTREDRFQGNHQRSQDHRQPDRNKHHEQLRQQDDNRQRQEQPNTYGLNRKHQERRQHTSTENTKDGMATYASYAQQYRDKFSNESHIQQYNGVQYNVSSSKN